MVELALAGVGLALLARIHVGPDIVAGRLMPVLEALTPEDREEIHAGQAGPMPSRVRVFIDYLVKAIRLG